MPEVFLRRIADAVTAGAQKGAGLISEARVAAASLIPRRAVKVGDIVHYVPRPDQSPRGDAVPAVVTRVFVPETDASPHPGMSNLQVFLDGPNDRLTGQEGRLTLWVGSVLYDEGGKPGTWHWPEGE